MTTKTPSARELRRQRKAALETQIEQQRIDIMVESSRWLGATQQIDRTFRRIKLPTYTLGGLALLASARHPHALVRFAQRGVAGVLLLRRAQRLLRMLRR
ncbi:YqjK family protein [Franzmannia qiaohouensis]|uniref:YqjK family protein n=1 Tax=Franzmannia qiaohouensis TaxID=1329370 RepID=A0ABU1HBN7_9GAMM|nr:YqjK family protein [Halomonas qiaohouensis]MDR5904884.1 YqjK family protein [Halomonas qiaohouensis]